MSFFFTPIPFLYPNYCVILPVLPYLLQIQGATQTNSFFGIDQTQPIVPQFREKPIANLGPKEEIQKLGCLAEKYCALKIQEQIFLQSKKATAALQSQEIHNENTQALKEQGPNRESLPFVQKHGKTWNKVTKAIKIKQNKQPNEEEYQPFEKRRKFQIQARQNQNRNIIPNEVNQIFSYIQKSSKSMFVVSRIFKKYPPSNCRFSIKRFYLYQSLLKDKVSNYINENSLSLVTQLYEPRCEVYSEQEQRYYNKVCRMLIQHFLQQDSVFNILTSRRMHKDKKLNHLQMRRVLKCKVIEILRH